ncbi:hypothetical protein KP509_16G026100 [Ceratopteris richardii]|uniref:Uncharacterized protein n=1 Tax=Ceratopteris richardii TaxID=49495 RepID=A0A8T2SYA8_CERRI|nr:hypothetical protein KP509_16G026100 [Ceratopteris richardii]
MRESVAWEANRYFIWFVSTRSNGRKTLTRKRYVERKRRGSSAPEDCQISKDRRSFQACIGGIHFGGLRKESDHEGSTAGSIKEGSALIELSLSGWRISLR